MSARIESKFQSTDSILQLKEGIIIKRNIPRFNLARLYFTVIFLILFLALWGNLPLADQKKVETKIQGKIVSMKIIPIDSHHSEGGVHLVVQSKRMNWIVHVGPQWVRDNSNADLGVGNQVMVIGTTLRFGKSDEISPSRITKER